MRTFKKGSNMLGYENLIVKNIAHPKTHKTNIMVRFCILVNYNYAAFKKYSFSEL